MSVSFEKAEKYIAKIPGAGKGQRNSEAFRISALLLKDFNLYEDEAWSLLTQWAGTCTPPLDPTELQNCFKSGQRYGSAPVGSKGGASRSEPSPAPQSEIVEVPPLAPSEPPALKFRSGREVVELLRSGKSFMPAHRLGRFAKFGLPTIDQLCVTARGEVGIIAAGTGVGKSTLLTQGVFATAKAGHKTALISLEMIYEQVAARLGAHPTGISHTELFEKGSGGVIASEADEKILDRIFFLPGQSGCSFGDLARAITYLKETEGITSVWIDYFTLVSPPNLNQNFGSAHMFAELSKAFKRMAQKLDISVVILAQFNRSFQGAGEKPTMYDIKETSQLEQDASWVLVMWEDAQKLAWAALDKNRMGKSGVKIPITLNYATQRINEGHPESQTESFMQLVPPNSLW